MLSRGACPLANAAHRDATFIGIRNYFKNLSGHSAHESRPHAHHFSSSTTSHAAFAAQRKPSQYELPTDVYFSEHSPLAPSTRFDWRLRTTSRYRRKHVSLGKRDGAAVYMKRVVPSYTQVQPGEPLHEEIQAYHDQSAHFSI